MLRREALGRAPSGPHLVHEEEGREQERHEHQGAEAGQRELRHPSRWARRAIEAPAAVKYVYALMHAVMTKVISLSERAYNELKKRKEDGESFSDVVLKMAAGKRSDSIMELAGTWAGDDAKEVLSQLMKQRRATRSREFGI
jgi:predicted CopG family antitoxin